MTSPPAIESPADLTALIEYQDGSVVSRTLIKSQAGTVTLFAFDAGEALSEHTAPFDALVTVVDGRCRITVGGAEHEAAAGQIMLLPADVPHALHATERFKMMLVMVRGR